VKERDLVMTTSQTMSHQAAARHRASAGISSAGMTTGARTYQYQPSFPRSGSGSLPVRQHAGDDVIGLSQRKRRKRGKRQERWRLDGWPSLPNRQQQQENDRPEVSRDRYGP